MENIARKWSCCNSFRLLNIVISIYPLRSERSEVVKESSLQESYPVSARMFLSPLRKVTWSFKPLLSLKHNRRRVRESEFIMSYWRSITHVTTIV